MLKVVEAPVWNGSAVLRRSAQDRDGGRRPTSLPWPPGDCVGRASMRVGVRKVCILTSAAGLMFGSMVLLPGGASAAGPPRITAPVFATRSDTDPGRTYTSPSIAVDPENPNTVVMGYVEART